MKMRLVLCKRCGRVAELQVHNTVHLSVGDRYQPPIGWRTIYINNSNTECDICKKCSIQYDGYHKNTTETVNDLFWKKDRLLLEKRKEKKKKQEVKKKTFLQRLFR